MKHPILLRIAAATFSTGILTVAIATPAVMVFGTPQALESSLKDSGAYEAAALRLSQEASDAAVNEAGLPLTEDQVSEAASSSFPPALLEQNSEQIINALYDWLQGETDQPEISVDLQPYIGAFTQKIGDQTVAQAKGLPTCSLEQLRQIDPNSVDIANLPCLPPGINLENAKQQAIAKVIASNDFLQEPVVTTANLPKDANGQTVFQNASSVPALYQLAMRIPLLFGILAVLSAACIVLLTWKEWKMMAKKLAWPLIWTGGVVLVMSVVARFIFNAATKPDGIASRLAGGEFKDVILAFLSSLQQAYTSKVMLFGGAYLLIGVLGLIIAHFLRLRRESEPVENRLVSTPELEPKQNPPSIIR